MVLAPKISLLEGFTLGSAPGATQLPIDEVEVYT